MSEDYESYDNVNIPDMASVLRAKVAAKSANVPEAPPINSFDPYRMMIQKKKLDTGEAVGDLPVQQWPEEDVKRLSEYCMRMGIIGFNFGRMHPIAALAMLKQKYGDYYDAPLNERVPIGYESMMRKKGLLHG
jgi:hypothetical protein